MRHKIQKNGICSPSGAAVKVVESREGEPRYLEGQILMSKKIKENINWQHAKTPGDASARVWGVVNPKKVANKYNNWGVKKGGKTR